jgi:hypothetical protein
MTGARARPKGGGRGFLLVDLVVAITIAGAVIASLAVAVGTLRRAERRMDGARADCRRLEESLLALQSGGKAEGDLQVERLGEGPAHRVWVRLSLRRGAPGEPPAGATLVGLIPADQAPGGAP